MGRYLLANYLTSTDNIILLNNLPLKTSNITLITQTTLYFRYHLPFSKLHKNSLFCIHVKFMILYFGTYY